MEYAAPTNHLPGTLQKMQQTINKTISHMQLAQNSTLIKGKGRGRPQ